MPPSAARPAVTPVVLIILDGVGCRAAGADNADRSANKPQLGRALVALRRTRRSMRRNCASACPRDRWATPRSVTSTSAPGRVVYQDFTRIDLAIETGEFARNPVLATRSRPRGAARRRCTCWDCSRRAACTATSGRSRRWSRWRPRRRRPARLRARLPRRPRHAAAQRRRVARSTWQDVCARLPDAPHRDHRRPLLRDGPRPALGARRRRPTT